MLDAGRLALFKPLGLQAWQLRRPELMLLQGQLPVVEERHADGWTLWVLGDSPSWLDDFCKVLPHPPHACRDWSSGAQAAAGDGLLILSCSDDDSSWVTQPFAVQLDARQGKRQLWLQLCAAGWLTEVSDA
jgi:DNA polymerase III psi subunit